MSLHTLFSHQLESCEEPYPPLPHPFSLLLFWRNVVMSNTTLIDSTVIIMVLKKINNLYKYITIIVSKNSTKTIPHHTYPCITLFVSYACCLSLIVYWENHCSWWFFCLATKNDCICEVFLNIKMFLNKSTNLMFWFYWCAVSIFKSWIH